MLEALGDEGEQNIFNAHLCRTLLHNTAQCGTTTLFSKKVVISFIVPFELIQKM